MGRDTWRPFAICAAIGAVVFLLNFHLQVLDSGNVHWLLQFDWGQSFVGWEAYRHDVWRFPIGAEKLLDWPTGDNIIFTDSFPALAIPLKILSPILPDPFQYVGWWFLISLILQVYFGYRLASRSGLDGLSAFVGAGLFGLTPFFLARLYHNTLFSHWMILWALEIYGFERSERKRAVGFSLLLLLSALTNFYLTVMAAGVFAADVLRTHIRRLQAHAAPQRDWTAQLRTLAPTLAAMGLVGYFGARQSSAGGFGVFSAELLAWINPQTPLASRVLPAAPVSVGAYEGFQYLGLGMIGLVLLGAGLHMRRMRDKAPPPGDEARFDGVAYLAPVLAGFVVFALSDKIRIGQHLALDLHYGSWLGPITSMLRSSGRFMWPASYALMLSALLAVAKLPRPWAQRVMLAALVLQIADLSAFMRQQWTYTEAAATTRTFQRLRSPRWDALIASAGAVDFRPSDPRTQLDLFWELSFRTTKLRIPLTTMYSARTTPAQMAFHRSQDERLRQGRFAEDRLYIFADGCAPASSPPLYRLDELVLLPPKGADMSGLTPAPPSSIQCRPVEIKSILSSVQNSR